MENKFKILSAKINAVPINTKHGKKAKKSILAFYKKNLGNLEKVPLEEIANFDYNSRVLSIALDLKKSEYFHKHKAHKILGLKTHKYAPELNHLKFNDGSEFNTAGIYNLPNAITYLIQSLTLEELEKL